MADRIVFFDLGDTLAIPRFNPDSTLAGLDVLPFVAEVLARMRAPQAGGGMAARLGLMSNTGPAETLASMRAVLTAAGLLPLFDPALLLFSSVEGISKKKKAFFQLGANRAGVAPARCLFVGEDAAERAVAKTASFHVSFHPLHAFHALGQLGPG